MVILRWVTDRFSPFLQFFILRPPRKVYWRLIWWIEFVEKCGVLTCRSSSCCLRYKAEFGFNCDLRTRFSGGKRSIVVSFLGWCRFQNTIINILLWFICSCQQRCWLEVLQKKIQGRKINSHPKLHLKVSPIIFIRWISKFLFLNLRRTKAFIWDDTVCENVVSLKFRIIIQRGKLLWLKMWLQKARSGSNVNNSMTHRFTVIWCRQESKVQCFTMTTTVQITCFWHSNFGAFSFVVENGRTDTKYISLKKRNYVSPLIS